MPADLGRGMFYRRPLPSPPAETSRRDGAHFRIRTDPRPLKWLYGVKDPQGQLARCLQKLRIYTFAIEHRPGNLHGNADALSRKCFSSCEHGNGEEIPKGTELEIKCLRGVMLTVQADSPPVRAALPVEVPALQLLVCPVWVSTPNPEPDLNYDNIARFQREDNDLREVLKWAEQQQRPLGEEVSSGSSEVKFWWARYEQLVMEHGILYIRWEPTRPTDQARLRVLTPRGLRSTVMKHFHDQKTAGHLGVAQTFSKLCRGNFYSPSMRTSARRWVQNCQECQRCKPPARAK